MDGDTKHLIYRIALPEECSRIREALETFFYPEALLNVSYTGQQTAVPAEEEVQHTLSLVQQGMAAIAIDTNDHNQQIVGVSIARCVKPDTCDDLLQEAASLLGHGKRVEQLKLQAHLERLANVCGRFRVRRSYHVFVLAVDPTRRRNAIGQKLLEFQLARAKTLGYQVVSADFTGEQVARIGARLGMRCVSALPLDQYWNSAGERLFVAPEGMPGDRTVCTYARYVSGVGDK
uniref:N-acetyltransferase domain-containing protein n=1 Tax=Anopheles darlingi TaxID=43151 RepID=A0A2M4CGP2_ANODA